MESYSPYGDAGTINIRQFLEFDYDDVPIVHIDRSIDKDKILDRLTNS